jgi:hypothetical protein
MPFGKPENKVIAGGSPIIEELKAEGVNVKPRLLVVRGTDDGKVVPAGADATNVQGIVKEDARLPIDQAFPEGHEVQVIKGPCLVVGILAENQSIVKGDRLKPAANGEIQKHVETLSVDAGATTVTSTAANGAIVSGFALDPIVAIAEETISTGVGETKPILMRLVI